MQVTFLLPLKVSLQILTLTLWRVLSSLKDTLCEVILLPFNLSDLNMIFWFYDHPIYLLGCLVYQTLPLVTYSFIWGISSLFDRPLVTSVYSPLYTSTLWISQMLDLTYNLLFLQLQVGAWKVIFQVATFLVNR